jgi:hypothetical protein
VTWDEETETDGPEPVLKLYPGITQARCRPAQLYLGSWTIADQLHLNTFHDANVYDDDMVQQWLGEVKAAVEWYLGGSEQEEVETPAVAKL